MNVADIDLDIFLDSVSSIGQSPRASSRVTPWSEERLRLFLETDCCLKPGNCEKRLTGSFVVHHDEAFPILEGLSQNGSKQLDLTHIDAHSDLGTGFGDFSWMEIGGRLLAFPQKDRVKNIPKTGDARITPANYLSYALACGFIRCLTYVHHPHSGDDLMPFFFRDFDKTSDAIEMRYVPDIQLARSTDELRKQAHTLETQIPFQKVAIDNYKAFKSFDHIILCQSPDYTPAAADSLISIFAEYVNFDSIL